MLAFQNTTYTKESALEIAKLHRKQDDYIRGTYGKSTKDGGWKGCSVGCMAKGKHEDYPELFGIDVRVAYLSDKFFENIADYKNWTVDIFESIKDGSDTTIAYYKFMHWLLVDKEFGVSRFNKHQSILDVADLFLRASNGECITKKQWSDAAAGSYAGSHAYAAAYAYAATYASAYASAHAYAYGSVSYAVSYAYASAAYGSVSYGSVSYGAQNHYEVMAKKLCYFLAGN